MIWPFQRKQQPELVGFAKGQEIVTMPCIVAAVKGKHLVVTVPGVTVVGDDRMPSFNIVMARPLPADIVVGQQIEIRLPLMLNPQCQVVIRTQE